MATQSEIVQEMIDALAIAEPDLDTGIGSVTRKLLDAVAEQVAERDIDSYLHSYAYDIDAKSGADLDEMLRLFGFARLPAQRSTGEVSFSRSTPSATSILIPAGTQVATSAGVVVSTVVPVYLVSGDLQVSSPAMALEGGTKGNASAASLTIMKNAVAGVSSVTNVVAFTGGTDEENDEHFRKRFKETVFRNMAGTECQPPGTQVLVPGNDGPKSVPIESLVAGDQVVGWRAGTPLLRGRRVQSINSNAFEGDLVVVKATDGRASRYTPNHRCLARLDSAISGKHLVYLMRKGNSFRIGKSSDTRSSTGATGLAGRMASQRADESWILSVHDSSDEALLAEQLTGWEFGIPTVMFKATSHDRPNRQIYLDHFWDKVGDLTERASLCLTSFGRRIEYPMMTRGQRTVWNRVSEIRACNLLDGCEMVDVAAMIHDRSDRNDYLWYQKSISVTVSREFYAGPVWSMDVDSPSTYIADGFATHNSMFMGVAMDDPSVIQANVVGATKRFRERIQLSGGTGTSTVQDAAALVSETVVFGPSIDSGEIFARDVQYSWNDGSIPPAVTSLDPVIVPDGVYDLEFDYTPKASRNDLANGISNRIDVYVRGERAIEGSETLVFKTARTFNNTTSSPFYRQNFRRKNEVVPTNGNFFVPYASVPLLDPSTSDQIVINAVTYIEGTHYWLVHDTSVKGGSPRSLAGIEIRSAANGSPLADPPNSSRFTVSTVFNEVPRSVEAAINNWRLVGTDVWVHQAKLMRLRLNFAIILSPGYTQAAVKADLVKALSLFIDSVGFNNVVQASDLLFVARGVPGVDAIRFMTDSDNPTNYAIQRVTEAGTVVETYATGVTPKRALDVLCGDDESPVLDDVALTLRAQNTWGAV